MKIQIFGYGQHRPQWIKFVWPCKVWAVGCKALPGGFGFLVVTSREWSTCRFFFLSKFHLREHIGYTVITESGSEIGSAHTDGLWINMMYLGRNILFISDILPLPGIEPCSGNLESIFYLLCEHLIYHISWHCLKANAYSQLIVVYTWYKHKTIILFIKCRFKKWLYTFIIILECTPGWEGGLRKKGYMYTYGWPMLLYGRNQHKFVKQLSSIKIFLKRKALDIKKCTSFPCDTKYLPYPNL